MIERLRKDDVHCTTGVGMIEDQKNEKVGEIVLEVKVPLEDANAYNRNDMPLTDQDQLVYVQCQFPMFLQYEDERISLR